MKLDKRRARVSCLLNALLVITLMVIAFLPVRVTAQPGGSFKIGKTDFELNGRPFEIRCGEMHFARIPEASWRDRLKMVKAMGLNTVCAYLFWNMQEKLPGVFSWEGRSDAARFCKIAQEEGLYVILRPGPYSCAEWDFGGFPWWLLKKKDLQLRTSDPYFLAQSKKYLMEVGKHLAPLQISHGGNIIMVQVENEYGSFGNDVAYMETLKGYLKEAGFDVPLFHCDGPSQLKNDHPKDLFAVVNFGSDPAGNFKALREIQPEGPLMCGEYYPGWFDSWGRPHHNGDTKRIMSELKYMLEHKASFSIYMVHGGTTFGTYTGANDPPYLPQTTSYDYDAPVDEAGNPTEKFYAMRALFGQYLQPGESLPAVPDTNVIQSPPPVKFTAIAALNDNLPLPVRADSPMVMEALNQDFGAVLYKTVLNPGKGDYMTFGAIHDYALVYLDDKLIGTLDRRKNKLSLPLPERTKKMKLTVLVEGLGRVNYGYHMIDRKGIHGPVYLINGTKKTIVGNWENYPIAMGDKTIPIRYRPLLDKKKAGITKGELLLKKEPQFFKGEFTVEKEQSTYLDLSHWLKGMVWINGKCLGRYWNIGPTQTMLVPGSWLKKGKNEIVVFDYFGQETPALNFINHPILDVLTETQVAAHKSKGQSWISEKDGGAKPYYSGTFDNNSDWQTVKFPAVTGRYFCLEALTEQSGQNYSSLAELVLIDEKGKELPRTNWKVLYADSEELNGGDGNADNVFDLQFTSIWHTEWESRNPRPPHQLVIDLDADYKIAALKVLPRQDGPNGRIRDYNLYFSVAKFKGL